jgi:aconitate hydratase
MDAMNLTKKILMSHLVSTHGASGRFRPLPGDEISIRIDHTLTHDITAVMVYLAFEALGLPEVRTELSVSYLDHNLLYIDNKTPDDHVFLQSVAKQYGVYLSRPGNGICHSVHMARFSVPGKTLLGSDSHTPTCGAAGMFAIGAGGMDVAMAMAGLPLRIKMPSVVGVRLAGRLRPGVNAKDVALEMLRRRGAGGGLGKVFEYIGPGVSSLEVPERATIANMGAEMGATSSIFAADETTAKFFASQGRSDDFAGIFPDEGCGYDDEDEMDLSGIEPMVARPDMPDNVVPLRESERVPVNQVYIGSCTNSSYGDIKKAAEVLKGRKIHENVSLTVSASTRQILRQLLDEGVISDIIDAGGRLTEVACGACAGIGQAPPTNGVSVRTSNRNFKGRAGTSDAKIYLVSPEVAAATAVMGVIAAPEEVMGDVSALALIREPEICRVDDSMIIAPSDDGNAMDVVKGPNIKPLPLNSELPDSFSAPVSLKGGDNISTDDITPAGAEFSSMRSNIPLMSKYAFARYDPVFARRAKETGISFIVGGENYGQGSSREHAAIIPAYLGVKCVIVKSMARIHRNNLINHGVVPMTFDNPDDYCRISQGDILSVENFTEQIKKRSIDLTNVTAGYVFRAKLDVTDEEIQMLLCGGLLQRVKKTLSLR